MHLNAKVCGVTAWDPLNTSDHLDVRLTLRIMGKTICPDVTPAPGKIKWESQGTRMNFLMNTQGPLRELIDRINSEAITAELLDTYFNDITEILHDTATDLPRTRYVKHYKPYWNPEVSQLKRVNVDTYRTWVNAGRPREPDPRGGGALRYRGGPHLSYVFRGRTGLFCRPPHVRDFVKEGYFFVPRYEVWGSKSPYNPRNIRGSDAD